MVVKLVPVALLLAAAGLIFWRGSATPKNPSPTVSSPSSSASADDTQIDYQNGVKVVVSYLPGESSTQATFLVQITSDGTDISQYELAKNIVLADSNIDPLPATSIKVDSQTAKAVTAHAFFAKFPGDHFHFLVNNLGGIHNRVLHFYRAL